MTLAADIEHALMQTEAEGPASGAGQRAYALEAGLRIAQIPAVRASQIDSAELIGFIHNTIEQRTTCGYDALTAAIIDRFALKEAP